MSTRGDVATPEPAREPVRPEAVTPSLLRDWPLPGGGLGKDDRGSVLVIGGARMTPGAALLAGVAALRAGGGQLCQPPRCCRTSLSRSARSVTIPSTPRSSSRCISAGSLTVQT